MKNASCEKVHPKLCSRNTFAKYTAIFSLFLLGNIHSAEAALNCTVSQTGSWAGGYQLDVKVTNTGTAIKGWVVYLHYAQNAVITGSWNASILGSGSKKITATNVSFNGNLASGASATFGLTGSSSAGFVLPTCTTQQNSSSAQSQSSRASSNASSTLSSVASSQASSKSNSSASSRMDVLNVNFQSRAAGSYTAQQLFTDFKNVDRTWSDGIDEGRAKIVLDGSNKALRVTYPANIFGPANGGVQFVVPFVKSYPELYFSYRVRFANGFNFVKGGKLPGLTGGLAPTGCTSGAGGFSARNMWRTNGAVAQYMYFPLKINACGDDYYYTNNGVTQHFTTGTWQTLEHHLVMNTPGKRDGVIQAWMNGRLVLDVRDFQFRKGNDNFGIENLYFSTFFGGNGQDWAPLSQQYADFDDLIVSEHPISH